MFALMPSEEANAVTMASLKLSSQEIQSRARNLRDTIMGLRRNRPPTMPFADRATELLKDVNPEKEAAIFNALAESGDFELLQATAKRFFPSELLFKLPSTLIKTCLDRLPLARRAELIISRPDNERATLLEVVGQALQLVRLVEQIADALGDARDEVGGAFRHGVDGGHGRLKVLEGGTHAESPDCSGGHWTGRS